jgi:hypothetical protein
MTGNFSFDVSWLPQSYGPPPVSATAASLTIRVGDHVATRNDDGWSRSVEDSARLALYPLALWLADSWWRLRWESEPSHSLPGSAWRMAHECAAAGHGFLWPNLTFASDSQSVQIVGRPANPLSEEPVRFLADFAETVPAEIFERAVDDFIGLVLARLRTFGLEKSDLERLWNDVCNERRSKEIAVLRRFEALLGFDAADAPQGLLNRMVSLLSRAGEHAADEIAPACAGPDPGGDLSAIEEIASLPGIKGNERNAEVLRPKVLSTATPPMWRPWEQGRSIARAVRSIEGRNGQPLNDDSLASLLGIRAADLQPSRSDRSAPVPGLAVRESNDGLRLHFRKRNRAALRFEAARLLCDVLIAPASDNWLPVTDSKTSRQKTQRAFAAEFLCPIESLDDFLSGNYSQERIEDAAERFGISPLAVSSHLANHNRISPWANSS